MVTATPVLPVGYVVSASRIADRRMILAGYRLVDLLTRMMVNWVKHQSKAGCSLYKAGSVFGLFFKLRFYMDLL